MGDVFFKPNATDVGPPLTPAQRRAAALYVCACAADAADARELVQALGLTDVNTVE